MIFQPLYEPEIDRVAGSPAAKRAIREFLKNGGETHSSKGLLLHHVLNHCVEHGVAFRLTFDPLRKLYRVEKVEAPGG